MEKNYNEKLNMMNPVWFDRPQFVRSIIRKENKPRKMIPVDSYEGDL